MSDYEFVKRICSLFEQYGGEPEENLFVLARVTSAFSKQPPEHRENPPDALQGRCVPFE